MNRLALGATTTSLPIMASHRTWSRDLACEHFDKTWLSIVAGTNFFLLFLLKINT